MSGEPIEALRQGIKVLVAELKGDPTALETVWLSLITFGREAKQAVPLTPVDSFPKIHLEASGARNLCKAVELLSFCIENEFQETTYSKKGDWSPQIVFFIEGLTTDAWQLQLEKVQKRCPDSFLAIVTSSNVDESELKKHGVEVICSNNLQPGELKRFFKWVSTPIQRPSNPSQPMVPRILIQSEGSLPQVKESLELVNLEGTVEEKGGHLHPSFECSTDDKTAIEYVEG